MFGKKSDNDMEYFTVYDSVSKTYSEPFPAMNREDCLRDFANAFRHPEAPQKNRYYMNAEHFSIFKNGAYSKRTGQFSTQQLEHVANLHDIRAMLGESVETRALSTT